MSVRIGKAAEAPPFQEAARHALEDSQLRHNMRHATHVIRNKRNNIVGELPDWEQLRAAASATKAPVMPYLVPYLAPFANTVIKAGGHVHWAGDADAASTIIRRMV